MHLNVFQSFLFLHHFITRFYYSDKSSNSQAGCTISKCYWAHWFLDKVWAFCDTLTDTHTVDLASESDTFSPVLWFRAHSHFSFFIRLFASNRAFPLKKLRRRINKKTWLDLKLIAKKERRKSRSDTLKMILKIVQKIPIINTFHS